MYERVMYDQLYSYFNENFSKLVFFRNGYNVAQCLIIYDCKMSVLLTIPSHIYFFRISKVWSTLPSTKCFYHFHFLFWWSIKFSQHNINQSETRIGYTKLSAELLYEWGKALHDSIGNISEELDSFKMFQWFPVSFVIHFYIFLLFVFLDILWFSYIVNVTGFYLFVLF